MLSLEDLIKHHKDKKQHYAVNYCQLVQNRRTAKQSDYRAYVELRRKELKNYKLHRDAVRIFEYLKEECNC